MITSKLLPVVAASLMTLLQIPSLADSPFTKGGDSSPAPAARDDAQPPKGLSAQDWAGIRHAYAASRHANQAEYIKASNTGAGDAFGRAVAIAGDTVVVGAPQEDSNATDVNGDQANNMAPDSGAAYVFVRTGTSWSQQAYLKASNTDAGDRFGLSVAISRDTVIVGAFFEDSNATGVNGDQFNNSAPDSGAAYIFRRSGAAWSQQAYLKASNAGAGDNFAVSVAIARDTVVVGARDEASNATGVDGDEDNNSAAQSGAAYVFVRTPAKKAWIQQAYLKASNTGIGDQFGWAVAIARDTVVVGAYFEDSNATSVNGDQANNSASASGAAYVFVREDETWEQQAYLKASNSEALDLLGYSVAIAGDTAVVGAYGEDSNATGANGDQLNNSAPNSGAAYVFVRAGETWTQQAYLKASNAQATDQFGISVAIAGSAVVVGAWFEDSDATGVDGDQTSNSALNSGAAYVFVRTFTTWDQHAYLKASNTGIDDQFGLSIAISGATVVVTAYLEDSNSTGIGLDPFNNLAPDSGAAYTEVLIGVNDPVLLVQQLIDSVTYNFPNQKNLLSMLGNAKNSINKGKLNTACNQLGAFINQVEAQSGKKIPTAIANSLIAAAAAIIDLLSP